MARVQKDRRARQGPGTDLGVDQARQAARTGYMWRVLFLSLLFGSLVLLGVWLWSAGARSPPPRNGGGQVRVLPQMAAQPPAAASPGEVANPSPRNHDTGP